MIINFKIFEDYKDISQYTPNFGDILLMSKTLITYYVMLDVTYREFAIIYSHKNNIIPELKPITLIQLNKTIKDGILKVKNVEDMFEENIQLVVDLYKGLQKFYTTMRKTSIDGKKYSSYVLKLLKLWNEKLPELKYHLETDKYNL